MAFLPPPFSDDVDFDTGPYNRDEIVVARTSLLHSLQRENSQVWKGIKYKLGIMPNGHRLRTFEPENVWLPRDLPKLWAVPVVLHDPTAQEHDDDRYPGSAETDRKRGGKEELSISSNAQVTGTGSWLSDCHDDRHTTSTRSSDGHDDRHTTSTRPSGKSREGVHGTGDQTPSTSGEACDDNVVSGKKPRKRRRKKRKASLPESSMMDDREKRKASRPVSRVFVSSVMDDREKRKASRPVPESSAFVSSVMADADEGSSTHVKMNSDCDGDAWEEEQFKVVFQCDLCSFVSQDSGKMNTHLNQKSHCSASRYVAVDEAGTDGDIFLVYLCQASQLNKPQHAFKEKVVACPQCHIIFANLSQCLQHSSKVHKNSDGQYCFRDFYKMETFKLEEDVSVCPDCGENIQDKELQAHVKKTRHMALYQGKRSEATMIFLCPFCNVPYFDYVSYKTHVFSSKHADDRAYWGTFTATCCVLGESQPAQIMLPQDPGVLKPAGHQVAKAKLKRNKRRIEKLKLRRQKLGPRNKEKPGKLFNESHKERLAAFKAKIKRKLR